MDATREHLWGQLLLERNLLGRDDLVRAAQERDAFIQRGQDVSLGQLLVHQRRLDPNHFASLTQEVEARGRACPTCRRVFFAARAEDPPACPQCGGHAGLRPASGATTPAWGAAAVNPGATARFNLGASTPASGRLGAVAPVGSARFGPPATGSYPAVAGGYPAAVGSLPPPATGSFPAAAPGFTPPPPPSGRFTAAGAFPAASQALAGSVRFQSGQALGGSVRAQQPFMPTGSFVPPPPSGSFTAAGVPPSGGFQAVGGADFDPMGGGFNPQAAPVVPPSTASEPGEDETASSGELGVGKRFGRYEIVQELGRGGMGVVYKVRSPGQQGFLAVKVLLAGEFASPKLMERFREEARLARKLRHPNIVGVHDVGEVDGIPYYAMDYIEGSELQDLIRNKNLPLRRGVEILAEVCRAAHYAHENGVVHRDLKPSNILISAGGQSYIMDFGLAKNLDNDKGLTRSGVAIGTPYYMPPEQARGSHREMDARSDVYALGAILYEILTRRVPFTAKTQNELLRKIVEEEPQPPRMAKQGIPAELDTICLKAIRKDKRDRYDSALEMAEDLERWLRGERILARGEAPWAALVRKAKRNKTTTAIVAAATVVVLASGGVIAVIVGQHQAETARIEAERLAAEKKRLEEEARKAEELERQKKAEAALQKQRDDAAAQVRSGLEASLAARTATNPDEALGALRRADAAFGRALELERTLGEKRQATAYRRGLVRRSLCNWSGARADLAAAAKDAAFQARAGLALGAIILRVDADVPGAEQALRGAVVAGRALADDPSHSAQARDEEAAAEQVARGYQKYLQGDEAGARRTLQDLVGSGTGGAMVAEACAALAFIARRDGAPLGGDDHVQRGLLKADQAVRADAYRYDVLCDRALLRARAGRLDEALADLRTARALHGDGELPDLAEATVLARKRDLPRMRQLLEGARSKVSGRPRRLAEEVATFCDRLARAAEGAGTSSVTPPNVPADHPPIGDRPETPGHAKPVRIERSTRAPLDIPASAGPQRPLFLEIVVAADVECLRLATRGHWVDMDLHGAFGAVPSDARQADFSATGASHDETVLLYRDRGEPRLRTGTYGVAIFPARANSGASPGMLWVDLVKRGEPLPHRWHDGSDLPKVDLSGLTPAQMEEARKVIELRGRGEQGQAADAWRKIVDARPDLKGLQVLYVDMLLSAGRGEEAKTFVTRLLDGDLKDDLAALFVGTSLAISERDPAQVARLGGRLLAKDPDFLVAAQAVAESLIMLGKAKEAEARLDELLRKDPDDSGLQLRKLVAQLAQGKAEAADAIARAVAEVGTSHEGRLVALEGLLEHGQAPRLIDLCDQLMRSLGRPMLELDLLQARAKARAGRKADALDQLRVVRAKVQGESRAAALVDKLIADVESGALGPTPARGGQTPPRGGQTPPSGGQTPPPGGRRR